MRLNLVTCLLIYVVGSTPFMVQADSALSLQQQILSFRDQGDYLKAINLQKTVLSQFEVSAQYSSHFHSVHLYNLGLLYFENEDYLLSRKPFLESITIIKKLKGPFDESLVESLASVGISYLRTGDLDESLDKFHEAQHIIHRQDGVKSVKQANLLDWMAIIEMQKNRVNNVDILKRLHYEIFRSKYGESHPRTVPSMLALAQWLQTSAQYLESVEIYERVLEIAQQNELPIDALQESLNGLAQTYYLRGKCCAEEFLTKRAVALRGDQGSDNNLKRQAFLDAADMSLLMKDQDNSFALYQEAWQYEDQSSRKYEKPQVLGISRIDRMVRAYRPTQQGQHQLTEYVYQDASTNTTIKPVELIGEPFPMCAAEIKDLAKNRDYSTYVVDLSFGVTTEGRATNIRIIETNAPLAINQLMRRMVKLYRFRPKLTQGVPVEDEMQLRQTFGKNMSSQGNLILGKTAAMHGCFQLATNY